MHELVCALARQPVDGLTLCVLLDQEIPEFSLFCWALKTGHTLTILSEDSGLSHRGQKHSRRNPGRDLERRSAGRHYPYSIFEFEETSTAAGTGSQWRIKGMVREGAAAAGSITQHALSAHRVRRISELEPEEITWTLLLALQIHEQYWLEGKKTAELAYTGEMVDDPAAVPKALLEAGTSAGLLMPPTEDIVSSSASPLAQYVPLRLVHLSQEHMRKTGEDGKNWGGPCDTTGRTGRNDWMGHRFSARANYDAVAQSERTQLALPHAEHPGDDDFFLRCARQTKGEPEMPPRPVVALDKEGKLTTHSCILDLGGWNHGKPVTYGVTPFKPDGLYGTRAEIERERFYIARRNEAAAIQAMADQEYAEQGASILRWFQQHVVANIEALKRVIAAGACEVPTRFDNPQAVGSSFTNRVTVRPHNMLRLYGITENDSPAGIPQFVADLHSGIKKTAHWKYQCIEDPAIAGRCAADFTPVDASGIAFLAGVAVSELPEYLQHWRSSNYSLGYTGNSILDLVDPVEKLRNPWTHVHFAVQAHFSKVTLNRWRKGLFRENTSLAVTLYPQWSPEQLLGLFGALK